MKTKNPLYVVKGKTVLEAKGVFDLVVKKMNLEPAVQLVMSLLKMLLEQINSYPTFLMIKKFVDDVMEKLAPFMARMASR